MSTWHDNLSQVLIAYRKWIGRALLLVTVFAVIALSILLLGITVEDIGRLLEQIGGWLSG